MASESIISSLSKAARGFGNIPIVRQLWILIGLSGSIALGFAVVLWSQEPNFRPMYTNLTHQETSEVLDALQENGIEYKVDNSTGAVLVPADQVYDARFKVASTGLLQGAGAGFDSLEKSNSIGTSRFMESARYSHALEGELARTISSLKNIKSARVHLAIPKDSVFVNDNKHARASVLVDLGSGGQLDHSQVSAIVHLVSSSIPNMSPEDVSVVDQHGRLLTGGENSTDLAISKEQHQYTNEIENDLSSRIESILTPLLGPNSVRAKVSAVINFNQMEQTQESYQPESRALRSEQVFDEILGKKDAESGGVPGAISNTPPSADKKADKSAEAGTTANEQTSGSMPKHLQATRNYELGKIISYSKLPSGEIKKLSVAVIVDNHKKFDAATGDLTETPLTSDEMDKITALVENAVGYDQVRGDRVSVVNVGFADPKPIEAEAPLPIWQQTWFWDIIKSALAGLFVLFLVLFILKPLLSNLAKKDIPTLAPGMSGQQALASGADGVVYAGQSQNASGGQMMQGGNMAMPQMTEQDKWNSLKQMADQDPKKIAQIMNNWVGDK